MQQRGGLSPGQRRVRAEGAVGIALNQADLSGFFTVIPVGSVEAVQIGKLGADRLRRGGKSQHPHEHPNHLYSGDGLIGPKGTAIILSLDNTLYNQLPDAAASPMASNVVKRAFAVLGQSVRQRVHGGAHHLGGFAPSYFAAGSKASVPIAGKHAP